MHRVVATALLVVTSVAQIHATDLPSERQADIHARAASVMPFSVGDTLHVFEKTATGGVQTVTARTGHDDQVPMIRHHLRQISESFSARDFTQPAKLHGDQMPGLDDLRHAGADELTVAYREIEGGAEVVYSAYTPATRDALHRWFDAQLADHGQDSASQMHPAHQ